MLGLLPLLLQHLQFLPGYAASEVFLTGHEVSESGSASEPRGVLAPNRLPAKREQVSGGSDMSSPQEDMKHQMYYSQVMKYQGRLTSQQLASEEGTGFEPLYVPLPSKQGTP